MTEILRVLAFLAKVGVVLVYGVAVVALVYVWMEGEQKENER